MSKTLVKNTLRDISRTKARFISIMLIILLGVGFFVGVNSTAPSMYAVVDKFYKDTNLMDFRVISTVGFSYEDVMAVENMEGVEDVMPSYFCDVLTKGDTGSVVRLYALPEEYGDNKQINSLVLKEGRFPQKENEIVIGASRFGDYNLGDTISFFSPKQEEPLSDILVNTEFEIVGIVDSPLYISFERGSTNVGSGKVAAYMMIPIENFNIERYTDLYITFSSLRGFDPYSSDYKEHREHILEELKSIGESREQLFVSEYINTAQASIDEAQTTLQSEKSKAEKEISDANNKINEGRIALNEEVDSACKVLADAKQRIEKAALELSIAEDDFAREITAAQQEIAQKEMLISKAEEELSFAKKELKESLFQTVEKFGITREQFEGFFGDKNIPSVQDVETIVTYAETFRITVGSQLKEAEDNLKLLEEKLFLQGISPDTNQEYISAKAQTELLREKVSALDEFIDSGKEELITAIKTITSKEEEINSAKTQVESAKAILCEEIRKAEEKFAQAHSELDFAQVEYLSGVKTLEEKQREATAELDNAQAELDSKTAQVQAKFEEAEAELSKAQKELDSIPEPQWLCYTRNNNPGFSTYEDDVQRIIAVGKVFPIFFLLVAVLVCVTTMTRLIEEQRSDLGALTTLGYRKRSIIAKYIIYCISATLAGSSLGIVLGVFSIPFVIFNAYRMLYSSLPELILSVDVTSAVSATVVAILCTSGVALITCNSLLKKEPATLLRPKAPKPGKRIFLERVHFIWSRLGFFSKVTVRNIFRYKARFFMTVLGIAGCTALIVTAFGLYTSINDVVDKQFGKVFTYDGVAAVDSDASGAELIEQFDADNRISNTVRVRQTLVTVNTSEMSYHDDTYICVPENVQEFENMVHLQQRVSGEKIEIGNKGVILSEKLAKNLGVSVGDEVAVVDNGVKVRLDVEGICENYLYGYVYMNPQTYKEYFGEVPQYNMIMFSQNEDIQTDVDRLSADFLQKDGVLGISLVCNSVSAFDDMIDSLNYVVLVMLVCAGALAFVVLYNLTNINIAERNREISTLKVLGFKDRETSAYIYRENLLLSIFGTVVGLLLGVWLLRFIVSTIEIDMLMFGREIHFAVYIISAVLTLVFAVIVNIIMHFRIKKIDMVESMKSVE